MTEPPLNWGTSSHFIVIFILISFVDILKLNIVTLEARIDKNETEY